MKNGETRLPEQNPFPRPLRFRQYLPALVVAFLALGLIPFADHTAKPIDSLLDSPVLREFFLVAKLFVSAYLVLALCAAIWIWWPARRAAIVVLLVGFGFSGLANEAIKQTVRRPRPPYTVLMKHDSDASRWSEKYVREHPGTHFRAETVDQWLFLNPKDAVYDDHLESFPSGHATGAFLLAAFLIAMWPRGRFLWLALAVACAVARIGLRRHFLEDVLFGGALGWIVAQFVFSWRWPARVGEFLTGMITKGRGARGSIRGEKIED